MSTQQFPSVAKKAADGYQIEWPRSDRSIATLAAEAAAAGNAAEAETLRCVALLFADIRKDREEAEKAEEAAEAAAKVAKMAAEEAEITKEAMACCSGCVQQRQGELLAAGVTASSGGVLPLVLGEERCVQGSAALPYRVKVVELLPMAIVSCTCPAWQFGVKRSGGPELTTCKHVVAVLGATDAVRLANNRAAKAAEVAKAGAEPEAEAKAMAALPAVLVEEAKVKAVKRSWWSRLFLCGTVAVEK